MKTRIFRTKFWTDSFVLSCKKETMILFFFLLTCPDINISGMFELTDAEIMFRTKLTKEELENAKKELEKAGKVKFKNNWIYVVNVERYNNYRKSPDNEKAYWKEIAVVPKEILKYFNSSVYSSVYSNNKSKIINNNREIENEKLEIINPDEVQI